MLLKKSRPRYISAVPSHTPDRRMPAVTYSETTTSETAYMQWVPTIRGEGGQVRGGCHDLCESKITQTYVIKSIQTTAGQL